MASVMVPLALVPLALVPLALVLLHAGCCEAMPNGPPVTACPTMQPNHTPYAAQTTPSPVDVTFFPADITTYDTDTTLFVTFTIREITTFRGFMVQARPANNPAGAPIGTFDAGGDSKSQTMRCTNADDTISHANRDDVLTVTVVWNAPSDENLLQDITFYYTIVANVSTFWVMEEAATITAEGGTDPPTTEAPTTAEEQGNGTTLTQTQIRRGGNAACHNDSSKADDPNINLVIAHGSIMTIAWGVVAPIGIIIALFYKVVWPNGEWFYAHIGIMCAAIVLTLIGIILILVHAGGKWLTSTDLNTPHQVLGIVTVIAVCVNPFLAFLRCEPDSKLRWIYNWIHGTIGLFFAQSVACATMLLGLHVYRDLVSDCEEVRSAIYFMSTTVSVIGLVIAIYNLYSVTYHKHEPNPVENDEDSLEPSRDALLRGGVGIGIIIVLVSITIGTISFIGLGK